MSQTLVGQFSKSEFFGVLPGGFYIFMTTYSCYVASSGREDLSLNSLWGIFIGLSGALRDNPALLIFLLFACYLFGSIFRALPVYWAEKTIPPFTADFPYPEVLKEVVATLNSNAGATKHDRSKMPDVSKGVPMHVYNYWKDALCVNSTEGFEYFQTFETRVRFFAGMLWAGWSGMLGGAYIAIAAWSQSRSAGAGVELFVVSLVVLSTFAYNFRRVRRQEARALLLIFAAWLQK